MENNLMEPILYSFLILIKITLTIDPELTLSIKKLTLKHLHGNCIRLKQKF